MMPNRATSGVVSMDKDRSYFMRRAAQERSAADRSTDASARAAHLELAERYRDLVEQSSAEDASENAAA